MVNLEKRQYIIKVGQNSDLEKVINPTLEELNLMKEGIQKSIRFMRKYFCGLGLKEDEDYKLLHLLGFALASLTSEQAGDLNKQPYVQNVKLSREFDFAFRD